MLWLSCLAEVILFLESGHTGRERERERERGGGGGGGSEIEQNLPLAWTSLSVACPTICMQRRGKRDSNVSASERRVTKRTVAYRPACLDPLESKLGFSHMSIYSQSAERAAWAAPNGVKKGATFLLVFRCLNLTVSSQKAFNGVQKGQVHSKKHKLSKKYFCWRSISGSPPAGLNKTQLRLHDQIWLNSR